MTQTQNKWRDQMNYVGRWHQLEHKFEELGLDLGGLHGREMLARGMRANGGAEEEVEDEDDEVG
jgi:hypothetical protein